MAGVVLPFFGKYTTWVAGVAHPSEAFEVPGCKTLVVDVEVRGLLVGGPGAVVFTLMESTDGQVWNPRGTTITINAVGHGTATFADPLRFVRLDALVQPGDVASGFAVGIAKDG